MYLDDMLWSQAIVTAQRQDVMGLPNNRPFGESILQFLIRRGVYDVESGDKPMDASTRSMRHASVMTDRLYQVRTFLIALICKTKGILLDCGRGEELLRSS